MAPKPFAATLAAIVVTACGGGDGRSLNRPTAPTTSLPAAAVPSPPPTPAVAVPSPSPRPAVTGDITLHSITPASRTTLGVRECTDGPLTRFCTDDLRIDLSVLVDRDVDNARITAVFMDGNRMCGFALSPETALTAARRTSFVASRVSLSAELCAPDDPPSTFQLCPFPATTTRIFFTLDEVRDGRVVASYLGRELPATYTFTTR